MFESKHNYLQSHFLHVTLLKFCIVSVEYDLLNFTITKSIWTSRVTRGGPPVLLLLFPLTQTRGRERGGEGGGGGGGGGGELILANTFCSWITRKMQTILKFHSGKTKMFGSRMQLKKCFDRWRIWVLIVQNWMVRTEDFLKSIQMH